MEPSEGDPPEPWNDHAAGISRRQIDAATTRRLRAAERGKHLLLLEAIRRTVQASPRSPGAPAVNQAYALLTEVEALAPDVVADALALPQVGGWAADCLSMEGLTETAHGSVTLGYLSLLAATAALRASAPFDLRVPAKEGAIALPGLGELAVPKARTGEWVRLRSRDSGTVEAEHNGVTIQARPTGRPLSKAWTPAQRLRTTADGLTLELLLDTDDTLTSRFGTTRAEHQATTVQQWSRLLDEAWMILSGRHRTLAEAMTVGLRTLVPLPPHPGNRTPSAASGWLWGAIALGPPPDAWSLAEALVHEFHHLVLAAVEDLTPIVGVDAGSVLYAPWRDDPRPVSGLLQGVYANIAMAEFWLTEALDQRGQGRGVRVRAEVEFAWRRRAAFDALSELETSTALTDTGQAFLNGLRERMEGHRRQQVSPAASRLADDLTTEHRLRWRLAHAVPDPHAIDALAKTWVTDQGAHSGLHWPRTTISPGKGLDPLLYELMTMRVSSPYSFAPRLRDLAGLEASRRAMLNDDDAGAERISLGRITSTFDPDAWVILGLVAAHTGNGRRGTLLSHPEVVMATHERIRQMSRTPPDPGLLSDWLGALRQVID